MKISASLYSSNNPNLSALVQELDELNLDFFHIDCFDGEEEMVLKDISLIQSISNVKIDLHAITRKPDGFFKLAEKLNVSQLTLQIENLADSIIIPLKKKFRFGLALTNDTGLEVLKQYESELDYILIMTTTPGKSGGKFGKESFERIRKCKQMFPKLPIYVDGGINAEVSFILRLLGVSLAVSGSFLVNNNNVALALADMRFHQKGSGYLVKDFMWELDTLPILPIEANFQMLVQTMEDYQMGFVLLQDGSQLYGICSNADLRRGILKNIDNLQEINTLDVINTKPITISQNASTYKMLSRVKSYSFPILFLPVVDDKNNLLGAITFNELIKGEG